jgi:hypothetical protein
MVTCSIYTTRHRRHRTAVDTSNWLLDLDRAERTLAALALRVATASEMHRAVGEHRDQWCYAEPSDPGSSEQRQSGKRLVAIKSPSVPHVIDALESRRLIRRIVLGFPSRPETRFLLADVSPLELAQSLSPKGYFTHFTAIQLNNLTEQVPKTVYFNIEQAAAGGGGVVSQEAIDRAFRGKARVSSAVAEYAGFRICKLSGRNTGGLGVVEVMHEPCRWPLRVTNLERTLIDAAVRPAYSGGVSLVAQAFENAKGQVSVNRIAAYLRQLDYTYPYHQAIGFYLERAGFDPSQLALLRGFPITHDFYLTHGLRVTDYVPRWRLFVPKGF